eukprot:CAMPEP_0113466986 /NCGR_PEP_ID=MMETSP0014_2-20120614/14572_1 /TAXON_ID=2857 /ORGANISM="Nitzschia sp." /LENGTH=619 /DNA_ID=CAMNT_0000359261 /DNA_START=106 /DNA_END=1962 /DNA_ORIENTATION=- /assembly_acc=CAM_ASM_000159
MSALDIDIDIKSKLKKLLKHEEVSAGVLDRNFQFDPEPFMTLDLQRLATSQPVALSTLPGGRGGEGTELVACSIMDEEGGEFLGVNADFTSLYIRHGYDELYDAIRSLWRLPRSLKVILLGNAGTGKSWFQIYVLRRLLRRQEDYINDPDEYDFVFRQVANTLYLIDIKEKNVFEVTQSKDSLLKTKYISRCLYFFEPGNEKFKSPANYGLPSLSTLSPFEDRISEYKKGHVSQLYFWPWSLTELMALCEHSGFPGQKDKRGGESGESVVSKRHKNAELPVDVGQNNLQIADMKDDEMDVQDGTNTYFNVLFDRYTLFGGIIRHVMATSDQVESAKVELRSRLAGLDLKVLQSIAVNIDRDPHGHGNVSGYILCYDGKQAALDARKNSSSALGFNNRVLTYTSVHVEEEVDKLLDSKSLQDKMKIVLDRLNNRSVDISGKNLEAVATEFLRRRVGWNIKRVGETNNWESFHDKASRTVLREYDISQMLTIPDKILVPGHTSFPVVDMIYSNYGAGPVHAFQCTWQDTHPFTVRALYDLRCRRLKVPNEQKVHIIFIVPNKEQLYAARGKDSFLVGSIQDPLKFNMRQSVAANDLHTMWENTEVYVLSPVNPWQEMIGDW